MISKFNITVYNTIVNHTVIVDSAKIFLSTYQSMEADIKYVISNLTYIVHNYNP